MSSGSPTREQADLAEVLEMVLDKGIVINADIAVTVGQTELLGIEIRAAIASFETAAKYGLAFPSGTDMRRVEQASGRQSLEGEDVEPIDLGIDASSGGSAAEDDADDGDGERTADADEDPGGPSSAPPGRRPTPTVMTGGGSSDESDGGAEEGSDEDEERDADSGSSEDETTDGDADDGDADGGDG